VFIVVGILARYLRARTSAANTAGFLVRAFRVVRRMQASLKPAALNSLRKAPPSFAPAIQANQLLSPAFASGGEGSRRINSAPYSRPPGRMHRANSPKIASLAGFRLKNSVDDSHVDHAVCKRETFSVSLTEEDVALATYPGGTTRSFEHGPTEIEADYSAAVAHAAGEEE
jgi:hypothetical protein